jgi:hypothetical protein
MYNDTEALLVPLVQPTSPSFVPCAEYDIPVVQSDVLSMIGHVLAYAQRPVLACSRQHMGHDPRTASWGRVGWRLTVNVEVEKLDVVSKLELKLEVDLPWE